MNYPKVICLETSSMCNRYCPTCIRNSHPDRKAVKSYFEPNFMPISMIEEFIRQYWEQGFKSRVCLCFYNEPLLDPRIVAISKMLKDSGIEYVYLVTNGDFLDIEMARRLDGVLDRITISLYYKKKDRSMKRKQFKALFNKTRVWIKGEHVKTHFNPKSDALINKKCGQQRTSTRLIINHKGQYLMCCDDLTNEFGFGMFPEISLKDYWFGKKHAKIASDLLQPYGRLKYEYCSVCPRIW